MPRLTVDLAADFLDAFARKRRDIEHPTPTKKGLEYWFRAPNSRWMDIAREEREDWVAVYINRQSRALEWFPVEDSHRHFPGVEVGYRYVKGYRGRTGDKGMAAFAAKRPSLDPLENHALLLRCSHLEGFEELVRWYAGDKRIGPGFAPAADEVSGEGTYVALSRTAADSPPATHAVAVVPRPEQLGPADELQNKEATGTSSELINVPAHAEDAEGTGWMADPARRKAVENHAVSMAVRWYTDEGFNVEIKGKPFDLLCTRSGMVVHVEVKGSMGPAMTIRLTRNEVDDTRQGSAWRSDLYIVGGIKLARDAEGHWIASGGTPRRIEGWRPHDKDLTPTEFEYRVP